MSTRIGPSQPKRSPASAQTATDKQQARALGKLNVLPAEIIETTLLPLINGTKTGARDLLNFSLASKGAHSLVNNLPALPPRQQAFDKKLRQARYDHDKRPADQVEFLRRNAAELRHRKEPVVLARHLDVAQLEEVAALVRGSVQRPRFQPSLGIEQVEQVLAGQMKFRAMPEGIDGALLLSFKTIGERVAKLSLSSTYTEVRLDNTAIGPHLAHLQVPEGIRTLNLSHNVIGAYIGALTLPAGLETLVVRRAQLDGHLHLLSLPTSVQVVDLKSNRIKSEEQEAVKLRFPDVRFVFD